MRHLSLVVLLCLFAATSLLAAQSGSPQQRDPVVRLSPAALQAAIDPATGQLRQLTAQEARELSESFMKSLRLKPLAPRALANGAVVVDLDDSFLNFYMARVTAEGELQFDCVNDAADAIALLVGTPASLMRRIPEKGAVQPIQLEEK